MDVEELVDQCNNTIIKQQLALPLLKISNHFNGKVFKEKAIYLESILEVDEVYIAIIQSDNFNDKVFDSDVVCLKQGDYFIAIDGENADKFMNLLKD